MQNEEITAELREYVPERFAIRENDPDFSDEVDLFNYGYVDSVGAVELTEFVEGKFGIEFTYSDWVNFPLSSIRDIASFVAKRREEKH